MIRFFTAHPTAANLLMLLFMVVGIATLPSIKRETFPVVNTYSVEVRVPYPGATPLDVEQEICLVLEDALDGISFVDEKICDARQNLGIMTLKMREQGDFAQFLDDVKTAVDAIDDFPDQAETAVVKEKGRTQNVVAVALTGDLPRDQLKNLAEQVKQRLLRDPAIPLVEIQGFSQRQLRVEVSNAKLRSLGLSLNDLAGRLGHQDLDMPVGSIETNFRETQLRLNDEKRDVQQLAQLVVLSGDNANPVRLGDIATIQDTFEFAEQKVTYQGKPAALLKVNKNTIDDSLRVLDAVQRIVAEENAKLPAGIELALTQDATSIVKDRINLLISNAWQGLILVFAVMWLFFTIRYAFWVVMGLPVSFLASAFVLAHLGITINMISMVALLLALGILMDDAIVIAESIGTQIAKGKSPLYAALHGTQQVARGVVSSFATTLCVFIGLVFIEGDLGQILKVIPIVLISVITVSLLEAFLILPSHLYHSLAHAARQKPSAFRQQFEAWFEKERVKLWRLVEKLVKIRYAFIGGVIAIFVLSLSMLVSGILPFSAFPNTEGDLVQARLLMPAGTPLAQTERVVAQILGALQQSDQHFQASESDALVKAVTVSYSENGDAQETGPHLATINVDLLTAERRNTKMQSFINFWRDTAGVIPEAQSLTFKEPSISPSGRAIEIRILGDDFVQLSTASYELQQWLSGYPGVSNLLDDLRPGKPEYSIRLKESALSLGIDAETVASQLRAAFQGLKVQQTNLTMESADVTVMLDKASRDAYLDFDTFAIIHPQSKVAIPLTALADVQQTRGFSRLSRVDNRRAVTVYGDIDTKVNNTKQVITDLKAQWVPSFKQRFPDLDLAIQGEVKNSGTTQASMMRAMLMGLVGIFILLSFQFKSYLEPLVVMVAIPLAMIGVVWGHLIMRMDFTMPSMLGFVSLAGIVVNDSILLVEFVKQGVSEGLSVHEAAAKASYDRFRAVLLTSITTIAGMTPLLFETSLQAQVLIPLATSIVFGIAMSTVLVLLVIPCLYSILEDFGLARSAPSAVLADA